jgi:hypothetical protein
MAWGRTAVGPDPAEPTTSALLFLVDLCFIILEQPIRTHPSLLTYSLISLSVLCPIPFALALLMLASSITRCLPASALKA